MGHHKLPIIIITKRMKIGKVQLLLQTVHERTAIDESEKHGIYVPTVSLFCKRERERERERERGKMRPMNLYVDYGLSVELAPPAIGASSVCYSVRQVWLTSLYLRFYIAVEMKRKSVTKTQTQDVVIDQILRRNNAFSLAMK